MGYLKEQKDKILLDVGYAMGGLAVARNALEHRILANRDLQMVERGTSTSPANDTGRRASFPFYVDPPTSTNDQERAPPALCSDGYRTPLADDEPTSASQPFELQD